MKKKIIVAEVNKCANYLDMKGMYEEANQLTKIATRIAQFGGEYEDPGAMSMMPKLALPYSGEKPQPKEDEILNVSQDALISTLIEHLGDIIYKTWQSKTNSMMSDHYDNLPDDYDSYGENVIATPSLDSSAYADDGAYIALQQLTAGNLDGIIEEYIDRLNISQDSRDVGDAVGRASAVFKRNIEDAIISNET